MHFGDFVEFSYIDTGIRFKDGPNLVSLESIEMNQPQTYRGQMFPT